MSYEVWQTLSPRNQMLFHIPKNETVFYKVRSNLNLIFFHLSKNLFMLTLIHVKDQMNNWDTLYIYKNIIYKSFRNFQTIFYDNWSQNTKTIRTDLSNSLVTKKKKASWYNSWNRKNIKIECSTGLSKYVFHK
jgi:hypothetical protein